MTGLTERGSQSSFIGHSVRLIIFVSLLVSSISALAVFSSQVAYAAAPTPPTNTTSRYMSTVDTNTLYNEGCSQGQANETGVVVLDFGQPWYQNGTYGTLLFGSNTFASLSQITAATESFLQGYWDCTPYNGPSITLAIGTSNYHGATTYAHGQAWALEVNLVGNWLASQNYLSQEAVTGAADMELGYNTASNTRAWADGYNSNDQHLYYDYGDAAGCPQSATTGNGSCNNGWKQSDVVYVAWDEQAALPLPEIYTTNSSQAKQWHSLDLYSYLHPGSFSRMNIQGSFTQYGACQTRSCSGGTNNTPSQGWTQLWNVLNADSRTAQTPSYSSDITWAN